MSREAGLTQSVVRALNILKCFTDETPRLRVTDISLQLGLTQSLVSRLLTTLMHEGFVDRDEETGLYEIGHGILILASVSLNNDQLRIGALSEMQNAARQLSLGVNLAVLDGNAIFYLAHVDVPQVPRPYTLIGRRNPLHATAMGKVLLAHLPDAVRQKTISQLSLNAYTTSTITDPDVLAKEVESVRAKGWALEMEELALSRACLAGPIRDNRGRVVAALSVSGPLSAMRWDERRDELVNAIIELCDRVSIRLGYITIPRSL